MPPLQVRRARITDADDLTAVWQAAAGRWAGLGQLPPSCQPEQPYPLERLIGSQDEANLVLLAEVGGKAVSSWLWGEVGGMLAWWRAVATWGDEQGCEDLGRGLLV